MVYRGEVGLIVTAMGAASGVFRAARGGGDGFRVPRLLRCYTLALRGAFT